MNIANSSKTTTKDLTTMTLLTALLCVSSYIIIPLPFSLASITAQTIIINLIAFLLKPKQAFTTIGVFLFLGLIGIPVFSGGGAGPAKLFGPTGGYLLGYLLAATVISLLRKNKNNIKKNIFLSIVVGMPIIYILGAAYMEFLTKMNFKALILTSVLPFIPLDILKCILAAFLAKILNRFVN
ncbi:MAG: biotin transporter BioY [Clostridium sp.]|nr:biotin transporter BioY [Clostridium sp.]